MFYYSHFTDGKIRGSEKSADLFKVLWLQSSMCHNEGPDPSTLKTICFDVTLPQNVSSVCVDSVEASVSPPNRIKLRGTGKVVSNACIHIHSIFFHFLLPR